jgi:hypothetical protein
MSLDINTLRKSRSSDFAKITSEIDKINSPQRTDDNRLWKLTVDKAGNGTATIRFLPRIDGDAYELPWVKMFSHGFQGPTGKWYIENNLNTLGQEDPVSQYNAQLWNSGIESNKDIARKQKRRLSYYANILVVSDPKNPENEGKVFIYKFGKKIFDKIMDKAKPTFEDELPVNVFDLWEGANFKLRQRNKDGYPNYDESTFTDPLVITNDDDKLVNIMNSRHNLQDLLAPHNFKSYDELKKKLDSVLAADGFVPKTAEQIAEEFDVQVAPAKVQVAAPVSTPSVDEDDDDTMAYFARLAAED